MVVALSVHKLLPTADEGTGCLWPPEGAMGASRATNPG